MLQWTGLTQIGLKTSSAAMRDDIFEENHKLRQALAERDKRLAKSDAAMNAFLAERFWKGQPAPLGDVLLSPAAAAKAIGRSRECVRLVCIANPDICVQSGPRGHRHVSLAKLRERMTRSA